MNIKKIRLDLALPATVSPLAEGGGHCHLPPPTWEGRGEGGVVDEEGAARSKGKSGGGRPLERGEG